MMNKRIEQALEFLERRAKNLAVKNELKILRLGLEAARMRNPWMDDRYD